MFPTATRVSHSIRTTPRISYGYARGIHTSLWLRTKIVYTLFGRCTLRFAVFISPVATSVYGSRRTLPCIVN
ncbi:hypothetical protein FR483_n594L [Paramecium bursaria Chlorella virus FR483]|uniref:Uncharacterized protein n594L n=1 Tax=Paramecium bursaria Chlorella virus FR483 TaxID=399781 RepID=A7J7U8_PBCVF|nr:hypothetical protein FR483_n594L [Paramecium bursaria Chlorella virus FR483]ABT15879.1 hypothetical protein FR483_n594L [Paramecium bursaria Chlorella virus FR483]